MRQRRAAHSSTLATPAVMPAVAMRVGVRRSLPNIADDLPPRSSEAAGGQRQYCRQARRLRASLAADPARLLRQLRELSHQRDRQAPPDGNPLARIIGRAERLPKIARGEIAPDWEPAPEQFARWVENSLCDEPEASIIRYSRRLKFLREAERRGVRRFHANLIIAAAQDRVQNNPSINAAPAAKLQTPRPAAPRSRRRWSAVVAAIAICESLILLAFWHAM